MRIAYLQSNYCSHSRAARDYCSLIQRWHQFTTSPQDADVVILHCEPIDYASIFRRFHLANKYVISCAVWEADDLPDLYKASIALVQEVWVPSRYCHMAFQRYHPNVHIVPYVMTHRVKACNVDRAHIRSLIHYDPALIYYLTITKLWDRRKNVQQLIDAFQLCPMPHARLVIKACSPDVDLQIRDPRIIILRVNLTDCQLSALYEYCDIYVSNHHSEGWGLTVADALLLQKPTIATAYSGNLDFMDDNNSFLLNFDEEHIHDSDCFGLFTPAMKWAYPSQRHLEEQLPFLYNLRDDLVVQETVNRKTRTNVAFDRFTPEAVARILQERLAQVQVNVARTAL